MPNPRRGVLDHKGYRANGLLVTTELLDHHAILHRLIRTPAPFRMWQFFFMHPNGVDVEFCLDPEEVAPRYWRTGR